MKKENRIIQKTVRLKQSVIETVEVLAMKENRNVNNMIETMLIREAKRSDKVL